MEKLSEQVVLFGLDDPTEICLNDDGVAIVRVSDVFKELCQTRSALSALQEQVRDKLSAVTAERDRAREELAAAGFYLAIIVTINVLLDGSNPLERLSKALLSLLSIVAAVVIAIRSQHARRVAGIEAERQLKRQERQERKVIKTPVRRAARVRKDKPPGDKSPDWRMLSPTERQTLQGLSSTEIKTIFPGISDRTARDWKKRANQ